MLHKTLPKALLVSGLALGTMATTCQGQVTLKHKFHEGASQIMDFKTEYTYDGTLEKDGKTLDKITSKNLSVTFALDNSPLPFSLKNADLKSPESEGVILFDRERGQIVESTSKVRVTGDITFSLNGKDLPAKLDLKMQSATVVKN